ncbi:DUF3801 domain-containing protein [Streptococcus pyogenes]|uniref:DUF3801 domain-containing protein n=1 Tax=Streptococcus pyogenes TaxID=1314 RepID=UPI0013F641C6|nr:DUF3801 domain-containing protein [Streptococcus pyogenes]QIK43973.1 PcfB family protein [Streptococcus pyogenes]WCE83502.1 DUF3801 domain-containing protein [Streptococcus pyogenes]WER80489.1 DUF3801 domain-containing protein [Streptococcus pyogenes]WER81099.1 DUF3801 domain-containing protein [Streptococcus pyogenes]WER83903.1 DUF3801 domain-containing protein [Streptococcus pyogenes]
MINEEISREIVQGTKDGITMAIQFSKEYGQIQDYFSEKFKDSNFSLSKLMPEKNEIQLKDLYKKGQLKEIDVSKKDLAEFKKELNRNGVKFSLMEDKATKDYVAFFQADNVKIVEVALRKAVDKSNAKKKGKRVSKSKLINSKILPKKIRLRISQRQRTRILTLADKGVPNRYPHAYSLKYSRNIRADRTNRSPRSERFVHPLK